MPSYAHRGGTGYGYDELERDYGYGDPYGYDGSESGGRYHQSNSQLRDAYAGYYGSSAGDELSRAGDAYGDVDEDPYAPYVPVEESVSTVRTPDWGTSVQDGWYADATAYSSSSDPYTSQPADDNRYTNTTVWNTTRRSRTPEYPPSSSFSSSPRTHAHTRPYSTFSRPHTPPPDLRPSSPKPTSPAPAPPKEKVPSASYLTSSLLASCRLQTPTSLRKLLVLDLNGTLLIRPTRTIAHPSYPNTNTARRKYLLPAPGPRFRPVHPRPYMPSFRAYLFHPTVRAWLDTMVWSSAQPHSVDDMVAKCFDVEREGAMRMEGEDGDRRKGRDNLVAVWARDTLGLTQAEYNSKTQTTKDLTKPWAQLPLPSPVPSSQPLHLHPQPLESPNPTPHALHPPLEIQAHSAHTTLLLDDSPLKAHLQPYNHVCIREYGGALRGRDLEVFAKEQEKGDGGTLRESDCEDAEGGKGGGEANKKRKRKEKNREKKAKKRAKKATGRNGVVEVEEPGTGERGTSVSSSEDLVPVSIQRAATAPTSASQEPEPTKAGGEGEGEAGEGAEKEGYDSTLLAVIGILDEIKEQSNVAGWIRAGGLWGPPSETHTRLPHSRPGSPSIGNDASPVLVLLAQTPTQDQDKDQPDNSTKTGIGADAAPPTDTDTGEREGMWFDHEPTQAYWVRRGRNALGELGIGVVHGIVG